MERARKKGVFLLILRNALSSRGFDVSLKRGVLLRNTQAVQQNIFLYRICFEAMSYETTIQRDGFHAPGKAWVSLSKLSLSILGERRKRQPTLMSN